MAQISCFRKNGSLEDRKRAAVVRWYAQSVHVMRTWVAYGSRVPCFRSCMVRDAKAFIPCCYDREPYAVKSLSTGRHCR